MVGSVAVGGGGPVSLQSMTNTDTRDTAATVAQIRQLTAAGCQLVRVAVPDHQAAQALPEIIRQIDPPLIADLHFQPELALAAIAAGVAGIRINPGTMRRPRPLEKIARAAAKANVAVRIGINGGSLEPEILARFDGRATPQALVESALLHCRKFEEWGCQKLKVSLKSSSPTATVEACRRFAAATDYPLHLGLTEAGMPETGAVKSAAVLGCLLMEGIGDTLRVSLTGDPVREIMVGRTILAACGLRREEPEIIACPTCGRTEINLVELAEEVEAEVKRLQMLGLQVPLRKIAVMGCAVNGPGEAKDADIGIAGGHGKGVLFRRGRFVASIPETDLKNRLLEEIRRVARPAGNTSEQPLNP